MGTFSDANKDPVMQMASMITEQGKDNPTVQKVMTLHSCRPIFSAEIMC